MLPASQRTGASSISSPAWAPSADPSMQRRSGMASANAVERRALMGWLALAAVVAVTIGIAYVWVRLQVSDTGYRLEALHDVIERLEQEHNDLTARASTLDSGTRIEAEAIKRLGMTRAARGQDLVLP